MRLLILTALTLAATPASAHLGHVAEVAGHAHWIGLGAIALAGALAALGWGAKPSRDDDASEAPDSEEEAPA